MSVKTRLDRMARDITFGQFLLLNLFFISIMSILVLLEPAGTIMMAVQESWHINLLNSGNRSNSLNGQPVWLIHGEVNSDEIEKRSPSELQGLFIKWADNKKIVDSGFIGFQGMFGYEEKQSHFYSFPHKRNLTFTFQDHSKDERFVFYQLQVLSGFWHPSSILYRIDCSRSNNGSHCIRSQYKTSLTRITKDSTIAGWNNFLSQGDYIEVDFKIPE